MDVPLNMGVFPDLLEGEGSTIPMSAPTRITLGRDSSMNITRSGRKPVETSMGLSAKVWRAFRSAKYAAFEERKATSRGKCHVD